MTKSQTFTVFNPSIWSPKVTEYFKERLVAAKFFSDYSAEVAAGGDTIKIPDYSQRFTVSDINTTSGEVSATNISETTRTLSIDQWKGAAFYISDFQAKQIGRIYKVVNTEGRNAAHDLAKAFDTALFTYTSASNVSDVVGDSATDILATTLERGISILESNSIPVNECAFFFHPYAWYREVQKNSDLRQATVYGESRLPNLTKLASVYGLPVFVTPQVPAGAAGTEGGHRNGLYHPDLVAYATQLPLRLSEKSSEALRKKIILDLAYGTTRLRSDAGIRIISNN